MQTVTKPPRSRMSLSRARTGCRTCKTRRVKCDEKKPVCQRCIRAKRHCAGYADTTASDKNPRAFNITYYVPNGASPWKTGISEDVEEEHALDYFYYWSVKCFPPELTVPFWQQDILHEPATRHAMIAMGILHEIYRHKITGPPSTQRRIAAMQHYGKAIQSLLSQHSRATSNDNNKMAICLLACLLFVCLEMSQGHHKSGLVHLQSGFRLFQGVVTNQQHTLQNNGMHASESILRSIFVRLMCQITHFDPVDCARFLGLLGASAESATIQFTTLDQARERFVAILSKILSRRQIRAAQASENNTDAMGGTLAEELLEIDQWILTFNMYLSHGTPIPQTCDSYILCICAFFLKFRLTMDSQVSARAADASEMDLAHIASLGDILFETSRTCDTTTDAVDLRSTCPLHRFFLNDDEERRVYLSEQSLFPFLGVFCSLFVSSMYSPNVAIRRKARDTVSKICRCGEGWDQSLSMYIASLLCPAENRDGWTFAGNPFADGVISTESRSLLALLRLFNSF